MIYELVKFILLSVVTIISIIIVLYNSNKPKTVIEKKENVYSLTKEEHRYIIQTLNQQSRSVNRPYGRFTITLPSGKEVEFNRQFKGKVICTQPIKPMKVIQQSFPAK